jgi:hypothetical protein
MRAARSAASDSVRLSLVMLSGHGWPLWASRPLRPPIGALGRRAGKARDRPSRRAPPPLPAGPRASPEVQPRKPPSSAQAVGDGAEGIAEAGACVGRRARLARWRSIPPGVDRGGAAQLLAAQVGDDRERAPPVGRAAGPGHQPGGLHPVDQAAHPALGHQHRVHAAAAAGRLPRGHGREPAAPRTRPAAAPPRPSARARGCRRRPPGRAGARARPAGGPIDSISVR